MYMHYKKELQDSQNVKQSAKYKRNINTTLASTHKQQLIKPVFSCECSAKNNTQHALVCIVPEQLSRRQSMETFAIIIYRVFYNNT